MEDRAYASNLALAGKRVLVTRPPHQVASFTQLLQQMGAVTEAVPLIEIVPPASWDPLDQALSCLSRYQYIILTSVNAVQSVYDRLKHLGHLGHLDQLGGARAETAALQWVCVGPKTAKALQDLGRTPDLQPQQYRAEAVIELLLQQGVDGTRVLYPRAQLARKLIPQQLQAAGAIVDAPIAYNTIPASGGGEQIYLLLHQGKLDVVTFTSSSSVENFVALLGGDAHELTRSVVLASIGPLTTATAMRLGLSIAVEAQDYTLEGLIAALIDYYAHNIIHKTNPPVIPEP
ncbi:MAG: uroporphyrinogen-III synthase [Thermodesulfobacteriota bacterium]|nr:uroporphyrinogen-III synthase [Thermodesulfobacteriota bacterium]